MKKIFINLFPLLAFIGLFLYAHAESEGYRFYVDKMSCAACISTLKKAAAKYPEFTDVKVSLETKELEFHCSKKPGTQCRVDALLSDLQKKGYPAKALR